MKPYEKLTRYWRETKAGIMTTPSPEADLAALEARHGIRLPTDFRDYLSWSCPAGEGDNMDNEVTQWWPLTRIKNIPDEYERPIRNPDLLGRESRYLFFADALIWCWAWAIDCGDGEHCGQVVMIGTEHDPFVASSFEEFIDFYIERSTRI